MEGRIDYPWKAEYAKSSRAGCKTCRSPIMKDTLRLGQMVQSHVFDGKIPQWHHYSCFWRRFDYQVESHLDIGGFNNLRWDDQTKIKAKISGDAGGGDSTDNPTPKKASKSSSKASSSKKSSGAAKAKNKEPVADFTVQYAKSSRSSCRVCGEKIEKNEIRISHRSVEAAIVKGVPGPLDLWHHADCFAKPETLESVGWLPSYSGERLTGYSSLKKPEKDALKKKLPAKRKVEPEDEPDSAPVAKKSKGGMSDTEKKLKDQNDFVWKIRDNLFRQVTKKDMITLLEYNDQGVPSGESRILDRVADCMTFGALMPCPECQGQLVVSAGTGYHCTGNVTAWTKCQHKSIFAKRGKWKIPEELQDNEYLSTFKFKALNKGMRVFPPDAVAETKAGASMGQISGNLPLSGVRVSFAGKLSKSLPKFKKVVSDLGGEYTAKVSGSVACVISNEEEVEKMSSKIKDAKKHDVHVVSEKFLKAVKKGGAALMITEHSIAEWGSDPTKRIFEGGDQVDSPGPSHKSGLSRKSSLLQAREEKAFTKSMPKKMKMTLKGGGAVDPESGLDHSSHVLKEKSKLWTATLGMVDIVRGTNSYYKLQLLESDGLNRYWLFRAWGRVGTTIGGNKLQAMGSNKDDAKEEFRLIYLEKTGNEFGTKHFEKYPNRFYPLDIDYGDDEAKMKTMNTKAGSSSKLDLPIQDLIKMIFDIDTLKKTMLEFEIDLDKMPLGKLSRKQIEDAYKVLTELQKLVEDKASNTLLLDASNRFYTLIPHNFGMKSIPLLDNLETIKAKTEMLESLLEIEIAYSMLKADVNIGEKDPLDAHYEQLKCPMEVINKDSEEFKLVKEYTKNTHAATHSSYKLEVQEVFSLDREGEKSKFKHFKQLPNRQLLWHGSRLSNYAGILSQGLRIAPPEAPVTGYMFGKGVYFADMVSKSANYCHAYSSNPIGLMILCEVALGNMYELTGAKSITKLPKGMHSCKGLGRNGPDPAGQHVQSDGLIIPKGKGQSSSVANTSLLYNEYIVYDTAQIKMKYLVKMNFKYSTPW